MDPMKTCSVCEYFDPTGDGLGRCTRYPPHPFPTGPGQVTSFWPILKPEQSCGEWKQRLYIARELPQEMHPTKQ